MSNGPLPFAVPSLISPDVWHGVISQPDGRDKVFKLIQYVCKLLRWFDESKRREDATRSSSEGLSVSPARAAALETALAGAAQAGRLFKWTSVVVKSRGRIQSTLGSPSSMKKEDFLSVVSDLSMFMFYLTDNLSFASKTGLFVADPKKLTKRAFKFWLVALSCGLINYALRVRQFLQKEDKLRTQLRRLKANKSGEQYSSDDEHVKRTKSELGDIKSLKNAVFLGALRIICDGGIACNGAFDIGLNEGVLGVCGILGSGIGIRHMVATVLRN